MEGAGTVSIITPVYNASSYVGEAIKSVLAQTYTEWELWLIDDASTDDSADVISGFLGDERIKLVSLKENKGAANARNEGIDRARGRYIAFIDADDIWHKEKLEKELSFMKEKGAVFAYTSYEFGDENAEGTGRLVNVCDRLEYKKALSRTIIFTTTVMFDTEGISKEEIRMKSVPSEDTATWWRILRKGYTAYGLNENLAIYRRPLSSLSSNKAVAIKRIWNLYRNEEGLGVLKSARYFVFWALRATLRRL
ncbi:MAG: glycosyltransferase [Lachnospiraceae bacterium]|nr:glycosyltransferase [Lachnospiraceae bacterium]